MDVEGREKWFGLQSNPPKERVNGRLEKDLFVKDDPEYVGQPCHDSFWGSGTLHFGDMVPFERKSKSLFLNSGVDRVRPHLFRDRNGPTRTL